MAFTTAAAVSAQTPDRDALRARQETLFEALSADPTNLDLMFSYAVASMRLEDYEPAIATFERMLIFNPDLPRVRLELGVAYYRLGVYEAARYQFEQALAADPPETVVARIEPFLDEIENRTARNAFGGFVSVGALYSSNANLGPEDRQILVAGLPGGVGTIAEEDAPSSDYGLRVTGSLRHRYDLRRPRDDAWISTLGYAGLRYRAESDGDLDALTATTGPRLSLDDEAFGLKARPYLGGGFVRSGGEVLYLEGGAGVELSEVVSPEWSLFGLGTAF